MFQYFP